MTRTQRALALNEDRDVVGRARSFVVEAVRSAGLHELADEARLVVSELVTNALLHGHHPAELVLQLAPPTVHVEVRDSNPTPPTGPLPDSQTMVGRGLQLVAGLAEDWGVEPQDSGKAVWARLRAGAASREPALDVDALLEMWAPDEDDWPVAPSSNGLFTVRLGDVPTDLLLAAKDHVDNLVREFTLATGGARTGQTASVPEHITKPLETVVSRFSVARQAIKQQALAAARAGSSHVRLELSLPLEAASAGEDYLDALDDVDTYCRAARMLTLESPARHRVFRRWYVEEIVSQLRRVAAGHPPGPVETFEQRLLHEIDSLAAKERALDRAARLQTLTAALAGASTPEEVAQAVLDQGVAALGATGGSLLLPGEQQTMAVPATVGHDEATVARLRAESREAELPAATALRTGEAVWLESREDRDRTFPELAALEPGTVAMCAIPLEAGDRLLGALRFSFAQARVFDDDERAFVLTLASQTAQALDRAQLHQLGR